MADPEVPETDPTETASEDGGAAGEDPADAGTACLLYTSPSPRD